MAGGNTELTPQEISEALEQVAEMLKPHVYSVRVRTFEYASDILGVWQTRPKDVEIAPGMKLHDTRGFFAINEWKGYWSAGVFGGQIATVIRTTPLIRGCASPSGLFYSRHSSY
jgi:hypothetical protein